MSVSASSMRKLRASAVMMAADSERTRTMVVSQAMGPLTNVRRKDWGM